MARMDEILTDIDHNDPPNRVNRGYRVQIARMDEVLTDIDNNDPPNNRGNHLQMAHMDEILTDIDHNDPPNRVNRGIRTTFTDAYIGRISRNFENHLELVMYYMISIQNTPPGTCNVLYDTDPNIPIGYDGYSKMILYKIN